jgi:hypothetical protein
MQIRSEDHALAPSEQIQMAKQLSETLLNMVEQTKAYAVISEKRYLQLEAWQFIGQANKVSASPEWITPVCEGEVVVSYEAKVNLINEDGIIVGSGIMECGLDESVCRGKTGRAKHLAAKSMAQTRAASKAYRLKYSWIVMLAGFQPTTAEEMEQNASSEYWCKEHDEEWFKKGRMTGYGHPIGDTGQWCHMSASTPGNRSQKDTRKSSNTPESPPFKDVGQFLLAANKKWQLTRQQVFTILGGIAASQIDFTGTDHWATLEYSMQEPPETESADPERDALNQAAVEMFAPPE